MLRNYIKTAWRNLTKNPLYTSINVIGLFSGISFALLIAAYVWQQTQVNQNLKNAENQYILTSQWKDPNMGADFTTLGPLAKALKDNYPNLVASYYRWDGITSVVSNGEKKFRENVQLGDASLLDQFGLDLLHGNVKEVFDEPYSLLIKQGMALKYFGTTDIVGKTLNMQNNTGEKHDFKITGVLGEQGENSVTHLNDGNDSGLFVAKNTAKYFARADFENWEVSIYPSYVEFQPGISAEDLILPLREIIKNDTSEEIQKNLTVIPVKLTDYYLQKDNGLVARMLYTLGFVGLFIVLMALMNFVNITISHSGNRMREIGIRKVLGGQRKQLIFQFLTESIVLVALATVMVLIAYPFLRPWFGQLIGKQIVPLSGFPFYFTLIPFGIVLLIGILAGLHPAFVLSSIKSIDSLKGKLKVGSTGIFFRKVMVGFQFTLALVVLIAALLVRKQVDYFFGKNLGYDKEYVVSATVPRDWSTEGVQKMETIRNEFAALPDVKNVSLSYEIPDGNNGFQIAIYKSGENPDASFAAQGFVSDKNYLDTYGITLLAGSFFEVADQDPNSVVINQKALETLHFENPEEALGKQVRINGEEDALTIKGIVGDFHFESMHNPIKPQVFFNVNAVPRYRYLSFKLKLGNLNAGLTAIQNKWSSLMPVPSFEYKFMDDTLKKLYSNEIQLKNAAYTATGLALIIVLLGIFGLVSSSIQQRIKEIGIRKVLGASMGNISFLFIKEFLITFCIAILVACPVAYLLMQGWLSDYAYRIAIGIDPFLIAAVFISSLTMLLIILQTLRMAMKNPVESLKE